MRKADKVYKLCDCESGDVLYSCLSEKEAIRVYDLIRFIKPELNISMVIELRKA